MNLPREIGWMRQKCHKLSEITKVLHVFTFDGDTIMFSSLGKYQNIICSGTFEDFKTFLLQIWKYYDAVVKYYYTKGCIDNLVQPADKFIYLGSYKRKIS